MTVQVKFTYDDYLLFSDDGGRHELIDGDHYITPSPSRRHQRISFNMTRHIAMYQDRHPIGELYTAPFDVVLSEIDVVQPDLLFVSSARASILTTRNVQGVPDLIIEILSETTRKTDEMIKRKLYERFGVQDYRILDPELEIIKLFRMTSHGYQRTVELSRETDDTLTTPLSPRCLHRLGYDFKRLFTLSRFYHRDRGALYAALQDVREYDVDLTGWLSCFVEGLATQMGEVKRHSPRRRAVCARAPFLRYASPRRRLRYPLGRIRTT